MALTSRDEIMRRYSSIANAVERVGEQAYEITLVFQQAETSFDRNYDAQRKVLADLMEVCKIQLAMIDQLRGM